MRINDVEIAVDAVGDVNDPAILLVAGAASSMDWWEQGFLDRLAAGGRHVIRYDTRDTGQSESYPPGEPGYTMSDLVDDAVGVLDALGVGSAQFAGISMGGALAQIAALEKSHRVDSLVLMSTSPFESTSDSLPPASPELQKYFAEQTPPDYTDRAAMIEHGVDVQRHFCSPEFFDEERVRETAARVFDRTRNMESSEINHMRMAGGGTLTRMHLADIAVPTLVLHGTADPLFALPHGEALARAIPGATLLPMDGVGHQPPPPATWDTVVPRMLALGLD